MTYQPRSTTGLDLLQGKEIGRARRIMLTLREHNLPVDTVTVTAIRLIKGSELAPLLPEAMDTYPLSTLATARLSNRARRILAWAIERDGPVDWNTATQYFRLIDKR